MLSLPQIDNSFYIGLFGTIFSLFGYLLQIIQIIRTREVDDLNYGLFTFTSIQTFIWIVYFTNIDNLFGFIENLSAFSGSIIIIILKIYLSKEILKKKIITRLKSVKQLVIRDNI